MVWYGVLATKEFANKTYKNLEQRIKLECDGEEISLPPLQGIVVLNTSSYMGGANFWGIRTANEVRMEEQSLRILFLEGTLAVFLIFFFCRAIFKLTHLGWNKGFDQGMWNINRSFRSKLCAFKLNLKPQLFPISKLGRKAKSEFQVSVNLDFI